MTSIADAQRASGALKLWDVLNAEAHVRTLTAAALRDRRARLDRNKLENLISFLFAECWRISGLTADGTTTRPDAFEYSASIEISFSSPRWSSLAGVMTSVAQTLGPYSSTALARAEGQRAVQEARAAGDRAVLEVVEQRARGIYDPGRGLAFSTFSRRILTLRVVDWYRETFGDSRYGNHQIAVSLNALADDANESVEGFLDRHMPGASDHFVDEWNIYVYDHVLAEEAVASAVAR